MSKSSSKTSFKKQDTIHNLSQMRVNNKAGIIGIVCSDLHLSHKPPIWRSAEDDWYGAMARQLLELDELQQRLDNTPIYCAGDIFDKWNSCAELINFAIESLPPCCSIAGQHDLPNHQIRDIEKSAYATLVHANVLWDITFRERSNGGWIGYQWNELPEKRKKEFYGVSLIHRYVWMPGYSYPDAPATGNSHSIAIEYDSKLVVCGDNHIPFYDKNNNVYNCGSFYRRNKDEIHHQPSVGIVYDNFEVVPYFMDITLDKHLEERQEVELTQTIDKIHNFVKELQALDSTGVDYADAIRFFVKKENVSTEAREYLLRIIDCE